MELKELLEQTKGELAGFIAKANEEMARFGKLTADTATSVQTVTKRLDALEVKAAQPAGGAEQKSLGDYLKENEAIQRLLRDRSGRASITLKGLAAAQILETKTLISSAAVGAQTTGVLQIERTPGIVAEARRGLRVRQLLSARPTVFQVIDFVRVKAALSDASPQEEGSSKLENAVTFESASEKVKLIATWIPATRQILDDFSELESFLRTGLAYYVNKEEEDQLLSGDGTGDNLNGLITQAATFDTALLGTGWNKMDVIGRAIQQIVASDEIEPTFVILNPNDWWDMRLTKDNNGQYILGNPQADLQPNLFNLPVVPTSGMASGSFLVGSGSPVAAEVRDRMEIEIAISTEHEDYFVKNKVAIRVEKRLALVVYRPNAFVTGSLTTSP